MNNLKDSLDILQSEDSIEHHGIKGMHWGIRRFQPYPKGHSGGKFLGALTRPIGDKKYRTYDVSYQKVGSKYARKTKYTNIDGSLNEEGKLHAQKYMDKQISKNEKYYDKYIKKYNKKAEYYKDDKEMHDKFVKMAKDAELTKASVNKSIRGMNIDDIMTNETIDRENALKAVKVAAGVTVGAAGGSLLVGAGLGLSNALQKDPELRKSVKNFDINKPVDSLIAISKSSDYGAKAEKSLENIIRTYSDAKAYVLGIGIDQSMKRMNALGVPQSIGQTIGQVGKSASQTSGITPELLTTVSNNFAKGGSNFINTGTTTASVALNDPQVIALLNELNSNKYF